MAANPIAQGPAGIETLSKPSPQKLVWISAQLTILAEARQAAITSDTLKLYASALTRFQPEDIGAGIKSLMIVRRQDGETAFPDLGTCIAAVNAAIGNRRSRAAGGIPQKELRDFDAFLAERVAEGESEESILARFPSMAKAWREWKG